MEEYQKQGTVCGIPLPAGLKQCQSLPEPIFTPSTKAEQGTHDENIDYATCVKLIGQGSADFVRDKSLEIFKKAQAYAESRGILLADTKFEWGQLDGRIILIDEVLTPDSSRFWPADQYEPGREQEALTSTICAIISKKSSLISPAPASNCRRILSKTSAKYIEAYERLTGKTL